MLNIEIKNTKDRGKGLFASKNFQRGEEVLVFKGLKILKDAGMHTLQIGAKEHLLVDKP